MQKIKYGNTIFLYCIFAIFSMSISSCDLSNRHHSISFNAVNPDNGIVTKITNIAYGESVVSTVNYDNTRILNAPSMLGESRESISGVIIADSGIGNKASSLWVFDGESLVLQTGLPQRPASIDIIYGKPTKQSIIIKSKIGGGGLFGLLLEELWIYDGRVWSRQTGGVNQPPSVDNVYGEPTLSSLILTSKIGGKKYLWYYNGKSWLRLTGGINQPATVKKIMGKVTISSILLLDENDNLWAYNGDAWNKLSGGINAPDKIQNVYTNKYAQLDFLAVTDKKSLLWLYTAKHWVNTKLLVDTVFDNPVADFVVVKDTDFNLCLYNGKSWARYTGISNAPVDVDNIFGSPTKTSIVLKDRKSNLWLYNGKSWTTLTGSKNQPPSFERMFGNPTASSIVIQDNDRHDLWVYDGKTWYRQTGGANQPSSVDIMFMIHQRELQQ
jgi:hypothetical protein